MATISIDRAPEAIGRMLRRRISEVMRLTGQEANGAAKRASPIWTGAYVTSWKLTRGRIDTAYVPQPQPWQSNAGAITSTTPQPSALPPSVSLDPVYVTNSSDYAKLVERGTPTVPGGAVAAQAVDAARAYIPIAVGKVRTLWA